MNENDKNVQRRRIDSKIQKWKKHSTGYSIIIDRGELNCFVWTNEGRVWEWVLVLILSSKRRDKNGEEVLTYERKYNIMIPSMEYRSKVELLVE